MTRREVGKRAYAHLQNFIQGGYCEIKQGSEDGRMVLSLEYKKACGESCQQEVFVALFQAAGEYVRIEEERRTGRMTALQRRLAQTRAQHKYKGADNG